MALITGSLNILLFRDAAFTGNAYLTLVAAISWFDCFRCFDYETGTYFVVFALIDGYSPVIKRIDILIRQTGRKHFGYPPT